MNASTTLTDTLRKIHRRTVMAFSAGFFVAVITGGIFIHRDVISAYMWREHRIFPEYALDKNSGDAAFKMEVGNYYYGGGAYDIELAQRAFEEALSLDADIAYARYQLARIFFVKGTFDLALKYINEEIALYPENLRAYYVRGLILGFRGGEENLAQAERDFRHIIENDTSSWGPYNDLAWILATKGEYAEVVSVVESAFEDVTDVDNNPWLLNSIGAAHLNLGNYNVALGYFESAKINAEMLTVADWRTAYPGNNPSADLGGLASFRVAINTNLERTRTKLSESKKEIVNGIE